MSPLVSTARPEGEYKHALEAGPPSPQYPGRPLPAIVVRTPAGVIFRTAWDSQSVIYRLPDASTAIADGSRIAVGSPPVETELMVPWGFTFRTLPLLKSLMYTFPALSKATP